MEYLQCIAVQVVCLTIASSAIGVELESIPTATGEGTRAVGTLTITATVVVGTFIDVCNNMMTDYAYLSLVCEYAHVNVFTLLTLGAHAQRGLL